jgi:hypothetical protein
MKATGMQLEGRRYARVNRIERVMQQRCTGMQDGNIKDFTGMQHRNAGNMHVESNRVQQVSRSMQMETIELFLY